MRVIYIHDQLSERQRKEIGNIKEKYSHLTVIDIDAVRDILPIRATPVLIFLREDLMGEENLIDIDTETKEYKLQGLIAEEAQKEERQHFGLESDKIEKVIGRIVERAEEALLNDMLERRIL